ncbi:aldose epimerase family protein [Vibrio sp. 10N.286.51.F4]|uniref:aldose epimerase family protein n=1 Tax=Vibrio sp. 10N.286.51.F4 TaxID=3229710 RepID=UPI00354EDA82
MSVSEHNVERKHWGEYNIFVLANENGVKVEVSDLGATIINFWVTDKSNTKRNIVLGYDTADEYLSGGAYIGAVVGPWGNRIRNGEFELNGKQVQLDQNEGNSHLHGGSCALHKRRWNVTASQKQGISLQTEVINGEGGYPANLTLCVNYHLNNDNELKIDYRVDSTGDCPVNPTQHAYFNLSGRLNDIRNHIVTIDANEYWQVDSASIPINRRSVSGTVMDFLSPKKVDIGLESQDSEIKTAMGYDHCYITKGDGLRNVARVFEPETGIELEVLSDRPAIQFYTGNHLTDEVMSNGKPFVQYAGLCLETQVFPDQVNMPDESASALMSADKPFQSTTIYKVHVDQL